MRMKILVLVLVVMLLLSGFLVAVGGGGMDGGEEVGENKLNQEQNTDAVKEPSLNGFPEFILWDWSVVPEIVSPGEWVTIAGYVENIGDVGGTDHIDLYVDGVFVYSEYITLDPYDSTWLSFGYAEDFPGIYEVMVYSNVDAWWGAFEVMGGGRTRGVRFE